MRILILIICLFASVSQARLLTTQEKLSDFHQLVSLVESGYGPYQYKQQVLKMNYSALNAEYEQLIKETKTNEDFYYLVRKYIANYHDGHFGSSLPTDFVAYTGVVTDLVQGKVLIDTVDRKLLSEEKFPFQRGDEIVTVDGNPISSILDDLQRYYGIGFNQTERRLAAQLILVRPARILPAPSGKVVVEIRRGTSNVVETTTLEWKTKGKWIPDIDSLKKSRFDLFNLSTDAIWSERGIEKGYQCSGNTRIAIPENATIIMKEPFVAYYHPTEKGNVGYLRIPHYSFEKSDIALEQYRYAVSVLEKNTVGLIIDQDHNCGGSVSFLENMVGLFMNTKYDPLQFTFLANRGEYFGFKEWANETPVNTLERSAIEDVIEKVRQAWVRGDFMTEKLGFVRNGIVPNSVQYTKPIVVLIDEMSGSGGDAFPAMMKGYGRAKLLGTRTMGLGGHVIEPPALNYSQINLRITKSLFFRPDGVAVENNGAVPDYPYEITRDDFLYEYKGYQKYYLSVLSSMIEAK